MLFLTALLAGLAYNSSLLEARPGDWAVPAISVTTFLNSRCMQAVYSVTDDQAVGYAQEPTRQQFTRYVSEKDSFSCL